MFCWRTDALVIGHESILTKPALLARVIGSLRGQNFRNRASPLLFSDDIDIELPLESPLSEPKCNVSYSGALRRHGGSARTDL